MTHRLTTDNILLECFVNNSRSLVCVIVVSLLFFYVMLSSIRRVCFLWPFHSFYWSMYSYVFPLFDFYFS